MDRPKPPEELLDEFNFDPLFVPAPDLSQWARQTFIVEQAPLVNADHTHLREARIGFLWTNVANSRHQRAIVGTAELGEPRASQGKWAKAQQEYQIRQWFGGIPDFKIIIYAPYAAEVDDVSFCSLVEHELYHCAQAVDEFGSPKFSRTTGMPVYAMKGHDVEEFVGIVKRYGAGAAAGETTALIEAANRVPEIGAAKVAAACGTCALKLA
jgi:hypothetical protein